MNLNLSDDTFYEEGERETFVTVRNPSVMDELMQSMNKDYFTHMQTAVEDTMIMRKESMVIGSVSSYPSQGSSSV